MGNSALWKIKIEGLKEKEERVLNTIFTVGNGYIGIRGRLEEIPEIEPQGIYVAGVYDMVLRTDRPRKLTTPFEKHYGYRWKPDEIDIEPSLLNLPNFLWIRIWIGDEPVEFTQDSLLRLVRILDMRRGIFSYEAEWKDSKGRITLLHMERFSNMASIHDQYVRYQITPINYSGKIRILSGIDGKVQSILYNQRMFTILEGGEIWEKDGYMVVMGKSLGIGVGIGMINNLNFKEEWGLEKGEERIWNWQEIELKKGENCVFEKVIGVFTTRDGEEPLKERIRKWREEKKESNFEKALEDQQKTWEKLWEDSDIEIEGDEFSQRAIRFCIYHLLISAPRHDPTVSIGAKGLTGERYRGMVFWDTDIYMLPFFIQTQPEIARNLEFFRYYTLKGAREKAKIMGYKGAMYPWETSTTGKEETERWIAWAYHQLHIICDVAYAVFNYWWLTGDEDFLVNYGAEILLETARFWASKVEEKDGHYEITDVGGPDEYHCRTDNNTYINGLVKYLFKHTYELVKYLQEKYPEKWEEFEKRLGYSQEEVEEWMEIEKKLKVNYYPENKLYEQCDGFFSLLPEIDKEGIKPHLTQTVKQPDVLLYLLLVEEEISEDVLRVNWDYYNPRTVHGSSLSPGVHAWIAARLGEMDKAFEYFKKAVGMDLFDVMKNTQEGIHGACCGAAWLAVVRGFGGVSMRRDKVIVDPHLPPEWKRLSFKLKWRGEEIKFLFTHESIQIEVGRRASNEIPLIVKGNEVILKPGEKYDWSNF